MRLIDELAAKRVYYHRPLPTLPDILLIDIPPRFSGRGLALDRYYPVILENLAEMHEFETFLCERRSALIPPALFDRRPSVLRAEEIIVARYSPHEPFWPWLQLCFWPDRYVAIVPNPHRAFARGAYTVDVFASASEIDAAEHKILTALRADGASNIRWVSGTPGHA